MNNAMYATVPHNNARMSRDNLLTLRAVAAKQETPMESVRKALGRMWSAFTSVAFIEKKNSMCTYYGHVIRGSWAGAFPSCGDCGCKITSPEQLRKASPAT